MKRFSIVLIISIICLCVSQTSIANDKDMFYFMKFLKQHNKEYSDYEEFHSRFMIFKENLNYVDEYDEFSGFMDLTHKEFSEKLKLNVYNNKRNHLRDNASIYSIKNRIENLPTKFDWREKNVVTKVKDQGDCGSCWTFSCVANLESLNAIRNGKLVELSQQQLVDCDEDDDGCDGGDMELGFKYLADVGGIMKDSDYPYTGKDQKCKFKESKVEVVVTGFQVVSKDEDEIANALIENGPLAIGINCAPFQYYTKGIFQPSKTKRGCNPKKLDHGMAIVGFGEENGLKYWIVKNSFGKSWGEHGYIRIERGVGACGINTEVSTATIK